MGLQILNDGHRGQRSAPQRHLQEGVQVSGFGVQVSGFGVRNGTLTAIELKDATVDSTPSCRDGFKMGFRVQGSGIRVQTGTLTAIELTAATVDSAPSRRDTFRTAFRSQGLGVRDHDLGCKPGHAPPLS